MKSKKDSKVFQLTESQVWLAEKQPTGFLVALWLDPETASALALPGGEPAESLHITLAYCGDASEMGELLQAQAIAAVAESVEYWNPQTGKIAGYGRFEASESSDGQDVFYASPDIPQLTDLRQCIVNCLMSAGVPVSTNHGYIPHITLSYLDSEAASPEPEGVDTELKFTGVTIMIGDRRVDAPFWLETNPEGTVSMSSDGVLPPEAPLGSEHFRAMFGQFNKTWIPFLPKPGSYVHEKFGGLDLTSSAYDEMLDNFNNYIFKQDLPIRATHMPADGGAIGYIKKGGMRKASDGSLEVKPEWNELGQGLVDGDRFRYVSAEFCQTWTNPVTLEKHKNVAVGLALVTRPHFKTDVLNPLSQTEALAFSEAVQLASAGDPGKGTEMTEEEKAAAAAAEAAKLAEDQRIVALVAAAFAAEVAKLSQKDEDKKIEDPTAGQVVLNDLNQVVITAEQRATERKTFSDLTARVELAETRASTAEAKMAELAKERRVEKFTAEVTGRSAENGVAWFGSIQDNVAHLVSLAESHGDDSTEVRWAVKQKRTEAQAIRETGLFDPISLSQTTDGATIDAQVARLAEQYRQEDPKLTAEMAEARAVQENPDIYMRSLKRK